MLWSETDVCLLWDLGLTTAHTEHFRIRVPPQPVTAPATVEDMPHTNGFRGYKMTYLLRSVQINTAVPGRVLEARTA